MVRICICLFCVLFCVFPGKGLLLQNNQKKNQQTNKTKIVNKKRKYCKAFQCIVYCLLIGIICVFSLFPSKHGMQYMHTIICILINQSIIESKQFKNEIVYDISFSGWKSMMMMIIFLYFFFAFFFFVLIDFLNANQK